MSILSEKREIAGARYVAAVTELRSAFVELSALDRLCQAPGFGEAPEIVPLRHSKYLPDLGGHFCDGVADAIIKHAT